MANPGRSAVRKPVVHFRKHLALPQQHGAWALWLGPYAVGLALGGPPSWAWLWLTLGMLGAFLALQPLTILVKASAGRRPAEERGPALLWAGVYGALAALGAGGLAATGLAFVLWLAVPALPVLAWQLWLVARRAERGQMGAEILGAAVLALSAPAAQAMGAGGLGPQSFWLWLLCALPSAGAITLVYVALDYRRQPALPAWTERWRLARLPLLWNGLAQGLVIALAVAGSAPPLAPLAFTVLLAETVYSGLLRPPVGVRPVVIGVRQTVITSLISLALIWAYRA